MLRKIAEFSSASHTAKVYRDAEWREYRVKFFSNGTHWVHSDYHTSDKGEALSIARRHAQDVNPDLRIREAVKIAIEAGNDEYWRVYLWLQVDAKGKAVDQRSVATQNLYSAAFADAGIMMDLERVPFRQPHRDSTQH